jgi:hypothetical protein
MPFSELEAATAVPMRLLVTITSVVAALVELGPGLRMRPERSDRGAFPLAIDMPDRASGPTAWTAHTGAIPQQSIRPGGISMPQLNTRRRTAPRWSELIMLAAAIAELIDH